MAELLIVVIIMIMLVAATLPVAKKVMDDSHVREASRQLNAYFQMAKSRAIQTGRPCGLYLECKDEPLGYTRPTNFQMVDPVVRAVTDLYLAEVPAPYAGSILGAVGRIQLDNGVYKFVSNDDMSILQSLLTLNEQFMVRFDSKGNWYPCTYTANGCVYVLPVPLPVGYVYPYGYGNPNATGVPFQIRRSPRKMGQPLALPTGTCIDMRYSGVGPTVDQFPAQPSRNMTILFTPNGGVDNLVVTTENITTTPPTPLVSYVVPIGTLYFLIGKVDKVNDPNTGNMRYADIRDSNLADPTSLWVTVGRSNGQVTTSENTPDPSPAVVANFSNYLRAARQVATSREQMRGR